MSVEEPRDRRTPGVKEPRDSQKIPLNVPEGFWQRCPSCATIIRQTALEAQAHVCIDCGHHFRISAMRRMEIVVDEGSFVERDAKLRAKDTLKFFDSKPYKDRLRAAEAKTGLCDAFISGSATILGKPVEIGSFEFAFMGGSMGTVVGEKVTRLFERALKNHCPAIVFHASGGARMQEGLLSLMQMAKTINTLQKLREVGVPYISVLTDPTTGGVAASFAMQGDVQIAEPSALVGFAGPRVIAQTINQQLPPNFQRSEFLLEHGMIDKIVPRNDLREYLSRIMTMLHR
ncbi:MAG TPA: acetyl-CoA carboxylase, carboxyltransferase subunit beta [Bdellovibrionota bacterium]|nr:acetyl-CoA carboxylase, carboxyltransferase subunit beta [Bdellovibrionota bacterium]